MLIRCRPARPGQAGFTLIEVMVTIVILAFGLLGLAGLQAKLQGVELDSYQRAQASVLMQDMVSRMQANLPNIDDYVTGPNAPLGTADGRNNSGTTLCARPDPGVPVTVAEFDACQWSRQLKGVAESRINPDTGDVEQIGVMIGARGCVERVRAQNAAAGVCQAAIYRVSVVWQGLSETVAPRDALACGDGLYGAEALRRIITTTVMAGLPACL